MFPFHIMLLGGITIFSTMGTVFSFINLVHNLDSAEAPEMGFLFFLTATIVVGSITAVMCPY